ncbi:glycosyltransferase family 2 protein [Senegalia sp. (in: firmicutes)]|uniref:glycosyltransferase family 2 protein n=1 Tax=Senegalia sp. (in: firmicutes) TaxID=1924098 RepID=UPI003F9C7E0C
MYNNKTVSVITPVYNCEKYIGETIESALSQTYQDIEIVLVDDCSTDQSADIINNYIKRYTDKIAYHKQEKNMGAAVARNTALDIAKGRYVAFLDSDDLWYSEKIEKQMELIEKNDAAICYAAIEMIDEGNNLIKGKRSIKEKIDYKFLLKNTMIATSSVVIDRNITGDFQMPLVRSGQDYATWLQLMRNGLDAYGINEVLVQYRKSNNSLSSNKLKSVKQVRDTQIKNENINSLVATYNSIWFAVNAFKKHYL